MVIRTATGENARDRIFYAIFNEKYFSRRKSRTPDLELAQISRNSSPVHHSHSQSHSSSRKVKIDDLDIINAHNSSSFYEEGKLILYNQHQIHKLISIPIHFSPLFPTFVEK